MSEILTCVTDWRSPAKWTKAQRQRKCDLASIGNAWDRRPINREFMRRCLVASAPAYLEVDGATNGPFNGALGLIAKRDNLDIFPDGNRFETWRSGNQRMYALNLNAPGCPETFASLFLEAFAWADGWHGDYYTNLGWLAGDAEWATTPFWQTWDKGLMRIVETMRAARPDWAIIGQQYHLTGATAPLNGLYLEVYPTGFGMTLAAHDQEKKKLSENGFDPVWVTEIRNPERFTPTLLDSWLSWAARGGYYVSWGRDATSLVGLG